MLNAEKVRHFHSNSSDKSTTPHILTATSDVKPEEKKELHPSFVDFSKSLMPSKDNREGMYRRGVVRALALAAAVETLSELSKVTNFGKSIGKSRPSKNSETLSSEVSDQAPDMILHSKDIAQEWPDVSCVVYVEHGLSTATSQKSDEPRCLHTEDLDVQVYLGAMQQPLSLLTFATSYL